MQCRDELDSEWTRNADAWLTENLGFQVLVCALFTLGCENSHRHEMRMSPFPSKCFLLCVEKTVNDDGVTLSCSSATRPCGLALDHGRTGVYSHALAITKGHLAAVGNLPWILQRSGPPVAVHHSMQRSSPNLRQASKP